MNNINIKKFLASLLLCAITSASSATLADAEQKPKKEKTCLPWLYDEAHVAYNQDFADKYKFSQDHVQEMPENLRYIELFIRTEFRKPRCYLNFSFRNNPELFKIPDKNYMQPSFPTSLMPNRSGWWKIYPNQSPMKTAKETMWIQIYHKYDRSIPINYLAIHDMYIQDDYVDVHSRLIGCSLAKKLFKKEHHNMNSVLQIQRAKTDLKYPQVKNKPELRDEFFVTIPFPKKWFEQIRDSLIMVSSSRCRNVP